jgi:hypothetical protein
MDTGNTKPSTNIMQPLIPLPASSTQSTSSNLLSLGGPTSMTSPQQGFGSGITSTYATTTTSSTRTNTTRDDPFSDLAFGAWQSHLNSQQSNKHHQCQDQNDSLI